MSNYQLKGAFADCHWCGGRGCMCCDQERAKAFERAQKPILTFTYDELDDSTLGPMIRDAIDMEALEHAFSIDGNGMAEIEHKCAVVSLVQALRKRERPADDMDEANDTDEAEQPTA